MRKFRAIVVIACIYFVNSLHVDPDVSTLVEDVVGSYELNRIRVILKNSTKEISWKISDVAALVNASQKTNRRNDQQLEKSIEKLSRIISNNDNHVTQIYTKLSKSMSFLVQQFTQGFSNLKLSLEQLHKNFVQNESAANATLANDCFDLLNLGNNASGAYWLQRFGVRVLCDMETEYGGWLVIQRRAKVTKQVDFQRDWFTYKEGFGDLDTEFWIGNDILHALTNQKQYEMRIEMEDYEKGVFFASYNYFRVGNEGSNYQLELGNYTGNATDAFSYHHQRQFTTIDRDNDNYDEGNCATYFSGGFWYDRCYDAHLNGIYPDPPDRDNTKFITWFMNKGGEDKTPFVLINVAVKIRPRIN